MSAAVSELERYGFLTPAGIIRGGVGRTSITYSIGAKAGLVIGVDCGTTRIHAIATAIDGGHIAEVETTCEFLSDSERFERVETVLFQILTKCAEQRDDLSCIVIALPNMISPTLARLPNRQRFLDVMARLNETYQVPILLENNVNCAALAEYHQGAAKSHSFAVYIQIGVNVGMGIVIDGKLFRGFKGGAGEIAHLPFPWSENNQPTPLHVESYLGAKALLGRAGERWASSGNAPGDTSELFARIESEPAASLIIDRHARDIGNLAAACVSVLDPELIVLGGGVGQNARLLPEIRKTVERLCWPVDIVVSELSNKATVYGAARLAMDFALARLLGENARAAFLFSPDQTSRLVSV
jgi:predicted NBD/HSP70 family sugar kinase